MWTAELERTVNQYQDNGYISSEHTAKEIDEGKDQQGTAQETVIVSKPAVSKNDVLVSERYVKSVSYAELYKLWPSLEYSGLKLT